MSVDWPRGSDPALPTEPSAPPELALEAGTMIGEYRIDRVLGAGGFGIVYQATQPVIGKRVAIKVLSRPFSLNPEMVSRFVHEARAVNAIRHPHIIDIFSFGTLADFRHFYVMEYLEGETLEDRIQRSRFSLAEALPILRSIALALEAAHRSGIAHRDLKAENVFLAIAADGTVFPKLLDFGIAKSIGRVGEGSHRTMSGTPIGTPHYMSPEQAQGREVDHRTDYYGFGILAFRMLTGQFPFDAGDFMSILVQQVYDPAPPASRFVPELGIDVDRALVHLLQKDPAKRPASLQLALTAFGDPAEPHSSRATWARGTDSRPAISLHHTEDLSIVDRPTHRHFAIALGLVLGVAGIVVTESTGLLDATTVSADERRAPLDGIWDGPTRDAIHNAFLATTKGYAEVTWRSVERRLDAYATAWLDMASEADPSHAELRTACLSWRLDALRARTELFSHADAKILEQAVDVAASLPDLRACANVSALATIMRPLADASARLKIEALRRQLETSKHLPDVAKRTRATAEVGDQAVALGFRPLEAEARFELGELQLAAGELEASSGSFDRAIAAGTAGSYDEIVARAAIRRMYVVGVEQARYDQGDALAHHAQAAIERLGGDSRLEAELAGALGVLRRKQGKFDESLAQFDRALAIGEAVFGATHPQLGRWLNSVGLTHVERGYYAEGRRQLERARLIAERERGADHPLVGIGWGNLALERYRAKDYVQAIALSQRALGILERAVGRDSHLLVSSLVRIADAYIEQKQYAEARSSLERALEIQNAQALGRHPRLAGTLASLGQVHLETGHASKALPLLETAHDIFAKEATQNPAMLSMCRFLLARAYVAAGGPSRGRGWELAAQARAGLVAAGDRMKSELAALDAWQKRVRRSSGRAR